MALNAFPVVNSAVNTRLPQCQANLEAWRPMLEKFQDALKTSAVEGNQKSLSKHISRGQVLGMCFPAPNQLAASLDRAHGNSTRQSCAPVRFRLAVSRIMRTRGAQST